MLILNLKDKKPTYIVRIRIYKAGLKSENITLCDCSFEDVVSLIKEILLKISTPIIAGKRTTITIRGGYLKGKYPIKQHSTLAAYGITPEQVIEAIRNKVELKY